MAGRSRHDTPRFEINLPLFESIIRVTAFVRILAFAAAEIALYAAHDSQKEQPVSRERAPVAARIEATARIFGNTSPKAAMKDQPNSSDWHALFVDTDGLRNGKGGPRSAPCVLLSGASQPILIHLSRSLTRCCGRYRILH